MHFVNIDSPSSIVIHYCYCGVYDCNISWCLLSSSAVTCMWLCCSILDTFSLICHPIAYAYINIDFCNHSFISQGRHIPEFIIDRQYGDNWLPRYVENFEISAILLSIFGSWLTLLTMVLCGTEAMINMVYFPATISYIISAQALTG